MTAAVHQLAEYTPRSPQLENGFIRIATELMEALAAADLTAMEYKVVNAIMRKTYGFNKKEDDLSASQIGKMCNLERTHVTKALKRLEDKNVIHKRPGKHGSIVGIQKDYSLWPVHIAKPRPRKQPALAQVGQILPTHSDVGQIMPATRAESVQVDRAETVHTIDNLPKDNLQQTKNSPASPSAMLARFDAFWAAYPKKEEKKDAKALFLKIAPDDAKLQLMLEAIARTRASGKWDEKRFVMGPARWLRGERWTDEVQAGYTDEHLRVLALFNELLGDVATPVDERNYLPERAALIDALPNLDIRPERGDYAARYFGHIRKTALLPWKPWATFDWLISREGHGKVLEHALEKK